MYKMYIVCIVGKGRKLEKLVIVRVIKQSNSNNLMRERVDFVDCFTLALIFQNDQKLQLGNIF